MLSAERHSKSVTTDKSLLGIIMMEQPNNATRTSSSSSTNDVVRSKKIPNGIIRDVSSSSPHANTNDATLVSADQKRHSKSVVPQSRGVVQPKTTRSTTRRASNTSSTSCCQDTNNRTTNGDPKRQSKSTTHGDSRQATSTTMTMTMTRPTKDTRLASSPPDALHDRSRKLKRIPARPKSSRRWYPDPQATIVVGQGIRLPRTRTRNCQKKRQHGVTRTTTTSDPHHDNTTTKDASSFQSFRQTCTTCHTDVTLRAYQQCVCNHKDRRSYCKSCAKLRFYDSCDKCHILLCPNCHFITWMGDGSKKSEACQQRQHWMCDICALSDGFERFAAS